MVVAVSKNKGKSKRGKKPAAVAAKKTRVKGQSKARAKGQIKAKGPKVSHAAAKGGSVLNERQRKFAERYATGLPAGRAYEQAGFKASGATANEAASRLLKNVNVCQYVRSLRRRAAESSEAVTILSIIEKRQFLARIVRTAISEVTAKSDLCQEHTETTTETGGTVKYKMPCKLRALELDAKLAGELTEKEDAPPKPPDVPVADKLAQAKATMERWGISYAPRDIKGATVDE